MVKIISLIAFIIILPTVFLAGCAESAVDSQEMLTKSWEYYKKSFISQDGRVIDYQRNDITTSEGQAYAMLRAVLSNDKELFDRVFKWSNSNIKRPSDNLYSWLWGKRCDGSWGIIDANPASDADIDIAYALIMASTVWKDKAYLESAKNIISDIWDYETKEINGSRVLLSGIEQGKNQEIELNPSYFAPYAFRLFDHYDNSHNWNELVDSSYEILEKDTSLTKTGLPTNWCLINADTGEISLHKENAKNDFSYDAIRTFIRIYIDYKLSGDVRAENFLAKIKFFIEKNGKNGQFHTLYNQDGQIMLDNLFVENTESIAIFLPVIRLYDEQFSLDLYKNKIQQKYNQEGFWRDSRNYYTQNIVWIGTWIYLNENRTEKIIKKIYKN